MKTLSELKETAYNTCLEIELLPGSPEQTVLCIKAGAVLEYIEKLIAGQKEPEASRYPRPIYSAQELSEQLAAKLMDGHISKATFAGDNFSVTVRIKANRAVKG